MSGLIKLLLLFYYDATYEKLPKLATVLLLLESLLEGGVMPSLLLYLDFTSSIGMGGGFSKTMS